MSRKSFIEDHPEGFEPESGAWGRAGYTRVILKAADEEAVGEAITLAWRNTRRVRERNADDALERRASTGVLGSGFCGSGFFWFRVRTILRPLPASRRAFRTEPRTANRNLEPGTQNRTQNPAPSTQNHCEVGYYRHRECLSRPGSPPRHRVLGRNGADRRHHDRQRHLPHTAHNRRPRPKPARDHGALDRLRSDQHLRRTDGGGTELDAAAAWRRVCLPARGLRRCRGVRLRLVVRAGHDTDHRCRACHGLLGIPAQPAWHAGGQLRRCR